jgi:hypothetical protein
VIEALAILGVLFVILTIVMIPQLAKGKERNEAAFAIVGTIWVIVGFAVGSWAVSWIIWHALDFMIGHFGGLGSVGIVFGGMLLPILLGKSWERIRRRHRGRADPF